MAKNNSGELLTNDFVTELFAVALQRRTVFDVVKQYIKYSYLSFTYVYYYIKYTFYLYIKLGWKSLFWECVKKLSGHVG